MGARDPYAGLGDAIKQVRLEKGLTRAAVKEQAEISLEYLGKIEQGVRRPQPDVLKRIAEALEMTPRQLLGVAASLRPSEPEFGVLGKHVPVMGAVLGGLSGAPALHASVSALAGGPVIARARRLRRRRDREHLLTELEQRVGELSDDELALLVALVAPPEDASNHGTYPPDSP